MRDQRSEVRVEGDEDTVVRCSTVEDDGIGLTGQSDGMDMDRVVSSGGEPLTDEWRDAFVDEEPQGPRRRGSSRSRTASAAYSSASRMSSRSR